MVLKCPSIKFTSIKEIYISKNNWNRKRAAPDNFLLPENFFLA
jgi:hypothetical protein